MGAVYEAVHDAIGRRVAIKVLLSAFAKDAQFTSRFFNEARAVNVVEHPGLVQISDFGRLFDGSAYLVMELLVGESLARRIASHAGPMPVGDALPLAWQLADSLSAAHAKGIVHRDAYEKTMTCFQVSAKDAHRRRTSHGYSETEDSSYSPLQLV